MTKPIEIITLGCRLNAVESEAMRRLGEDVHLDDTIVVNTCAVTNEAARQSRQHIRRLRRNRPDARIIATGCAAQIDPQQFADMDEVDFVIGNAEKLAPATWSTLSADTQAPISVNDIMSVRENAGHMIDGYGERSRAFLQVQNGCDHRCTFCIIPFGRGNARSTPIDVLIDQAKRLIDNGYAEIVLTGVDITSYGNDLSDQPSLGDLVDRLLDAAPGLRSLRLSSIDGAEIDEKLFAHITEDTRVAPYLHLSVQAGDDLILKRMKRRHSRWDIIKLCDRIRAKRPNVAFGADLIAGFPTETEAMFDNTVRIIDDAGLQYCHIFPFSPKGGTPAARMPQLDRQLVKKRAATLREKATVALSTFLQSLVGGSYDAVVESGGRARLGNFALVNLAVSDADAGDWVQVRVRERDGLRLSASVI
ncbi:MAG: tRNA (N(6)-L-threonylcarbamoyladenosine(37)-C(2))-methylthiotransferase MtaB [Pseudomonadota bacterium]